MKRTDAVVIRLYKAAQAYAEANGGTVVVAGGVALMEFERPMTYGIVVRCAGRKPTFDKPNSRTKRRGSK